LSGNLQKGVQNIKKAPTPSTYRETQTAVIAELGKPGHIGVSVGLAFINLTCWGQNEWWSWYSKIL